MLFGSSFLCWRVKYLVIEKELCTAHAAVTPHVSQQENAAAGSSSLETWGSNSSRAGLGQNEVLSIFSSHLQACIFRAVKTALLLCCLWQWVWPCLLLALISGGSARGDGGGASSLGILSQPLYPSPVCCEARTGHGARSPVFLYLLLGTFAAHISYRQWPAVESWHCLDWADKRKGWECSACQRCWVFFWFGGVKCKLRARAMQQVVYIQAEKLHVFPCQSSCICDYSCSMETQGQAVFTELEWHSSSVYSGEKQLPWTLVLCMHRPTVVC